MFGLFGRQGQIKPDGDTEELSINGSLPWVGRRGGRVEVVGIYYPV